MIAEIVNFGSWAEFHRSELLFSPDIFADGHGSDDFLYGFLLLFLAIGIEFGLQLENLPLFRRRKILGVRHFRHFGSLCRLGRREADAREEERKADARK